MIKKDIKVKFKGNIMRPLWNKSGVDHKNKTFFHIFLLLKKKDPGGTGAESATPSAASTPKSKVLYFSCLQACEKL